MDDLPYYVINPFWLRWREKAGARPVTIASLSMDKAPPALPEPPTVPVAKEAPAPVRDSLDAMVDDIHQVVDAFSRFKTWVKTPAPSKPPQSERKEPFVPPFDIQEIPDAMRREGMPIGARLMERWFAGRLMTAKKIIAILVLAATGYLTLFDRVPLGHGCEKSISPDRVYTAELCTVGGQGRGFYDYAARLFDGKSGRLLAQHTFTAADPGIEWFEASPNNGNIAYVAFTTGGDGGDNDTFIDLPPSLWERVLAMRPRLR